jgi:uncharacterized protein (DUF2147 family)
MPIPSLSRGTRALLAGAALIVSAPAFSQAASDPRGRWITASGNLEVEVAPCGAALCGIVTKVLANRSMSGEGEMHAVDTRPAVGMPILLRFMRADDGSPDTPPTEWNGQIYNRENGKTYACTMRVDTGSIAAGELVLRPYVGLPLFGKTQRWQRAP